MAAGDIDELIFSDAVPPETPDATPPAGPADVAPDIDDVLSCQVCGTSLSYSGRGRKPKYCDDHKKGSGSGNGTVAKRTVGRVTANDKLAAQATEALVQINRLTAMVGGLLGLDTTREMVMHCEDGFREQAYEALLTDPALCKQILSAGAVSAKFSLATAYGLMFAQVAPVAMMEVKAKRQEKAAREEAAA